MLTSKKYNVTASAPVVAASTDTEAKVFWDGTVTSTATSSAVTVKGATNSSAYVYCMVSKTGTAVVKATTTTTTTTNTTNATVVDKWAAEKKYTEKEWADKYNG